MLLNLVKGNMPYMLLLAIGYNQQSRAGRDSEAKI